MLRAIVGGPAPWQAPTELAVRLGWGVDETVDVLAMMDLEGWLGIWDRAKGPVVTLSPLGAERMGLRLVESSLDQSPHWGLRGEPAPPQPRARNVCASARAADLSFLLDPSPSPDLAFERSEAAGRAADRARRSLLDPDPEDREENVPRPTLLLGQGLTPWPGPGRDRGSECPACRNRRLEPHAYCLCCDRWGMDHLFASRVPAAGNRRAGGRYDVASAPSAEVNPSPGGDHAKRRRKSRRRSRSRSRNEGDARLKPDNPEGPAAGNPRPVDKTPPRPPVNGHRQPRAPLPSRNGGQAR